MTDVFVQNTGTAFEDGGTTDFTGIPDLSVQLVNAGKDVTNGSAYGETIDTATDVNTNSLTVADYDKIQLVFRDSNTDAEVFKSPVLEVDTLEVSDLLYTPSQVQVTEVEMPAAPTGGETFTLKITNLESGAQPFEYRSYEIEAEDGDSAANVVTKFVAAINSREDSINDFEGSSVTAAVNNGDSTKLDLTANDVGDVFDVATQNFDPVSVSTTNPTMGVGTYEQVLRAEENTRGTLGRYVQSTNILGSLPEPPTYADPANNYDLLNITAENDYDQSMNKSVQRITYLVALEESSVATSNYTDFLDPKIVASG